MAQIVTGWASHLSHFELKHELEKLEQARTEEQRKLTRKARRTPRHVLLQRRPSVAIVTVCERG